MSVYRRLPNDGTIRNNSDLPNVSYKIDKKYKSFLKHIEIGDIYDVPVRKNCLTGSGKALMCHWNVGMLNKKYGGKTVLGYHIFISPKEKCQSEMLEGRLYNGYEMLNIISHSCWETPEGNLVDVTYGSQDKFMKEIKSDKTILFAPMVRYDCRNENAMGLFNFALKRNYKKTGTITLSSASKGLVIDSDYDVDNDAQQESLHFQSQSTSGITFNESSVIKYLKTINKDGVLNVFNEDENEYEQLPIEDFILFNAPEFYGTATMKSQFNTDLYQRRVA